MSRLCDLDASQIIDNVDRLPNLNISQTIEDFENICGIPRVSFNGKNGIKKHSEEHFDNRVKQCIIKQGIPLVIDGIAVQSSSTLYKRDWLSEICENTASQQYQDLRASNRFECPEDLEEALEQHLPAPLHQYDTGNSDSYLHTSEESLRAGDLRQYLPFSQQHRSILCYLGEKGMQTPMQTTHCASISYHCMLSQVTQTRSNPREAHGALWFIIPADQDQQAMRLIERASRKGSFVSFDDLLKSPLRVYIKEQTAGELIILPPMSYYQIHHRGTQSLCLHWTKVTSASIQLAINMVLPALSKVCTREVFQTKLTAYRALLQHMTILSAIQADCAVSGRSIMDDKTIAFLEDCTVLFNLFESMLLSEAFEQAYEPATIQRHEEGSAAICSFCGSSIWNRYLTCSSCVRPGSGDAEQFDICLSCYTNGRKCMCNRQLDWVEQNEWTHLLTQHESFRRLVSIVSPNNTLPSFAQLTRISKTHSAATVAQLLLQARPRMQIQQQLGSNHGPDVHVGFRAATIKQLSTGVCHSCRTILPTWRMARCSGCNKDWCFDELYLYLDLLPADVLQEKRWHCPHCQKNCFAQDCFTKPGNHFKHSKHDMQDLVLGSSLDPRGIDIFLDRQHLTELISKQNSVQPPQPRVKHTAKPQPRQAARRTAMTRSMSGNTIEHIRLETTPDRDFEASLDSASSDLDVDTQVVATQANDDRVQDYDTQTTQWPGFASSAVPFVSSSEQHVYTPPKTIRKPATTKPTLSSRLPRMIPLQGVATTPQRAVPRFAPATTRPASKLFWTPHIDKAKAAATLRKPVNNAESATWAKPSADNYRAVATPKSALQPMRQTHIPFPQAAYVEQAQDDDLLERSSQRLMQLSIEPENVDPNNVEPDHEGEDYTRYMKTPSPPTQESNNILSIKRAPRYGPPLRPKDPNAQTTDRNKRRRISKA